MKIITHQRKPPPEVAAVVEEALGLARTKEREGLERAVRVLSQASVHFPKDIRIQRLLGELRTELAGAGERLTVEAAQRAFANLRDGAETLRGAAKAEGPYVKHVGDRIGKLDLRMLQSVVKLAEVPYLERNCPAATILCLGDKVVGAGVNRSYRPMRSFFRHAEMEALQAVQQRIYIGIAEVLLLYRDQGGEIDPRTSERLDVLEKQGLRRELRLDPRGLRDAGFFEHGKIAAYSRDLEAILEEGLLRRDADGHIHSSHRDLLDQLRESGFIAKADLADWSVYDRIHNGDRSLKLTLYSSLEPCGMCMQNCTSHQHIGRIVFASADEAGGAVSALKNYPAIYFDEDRVPFEIVHVSEGPIQARAETLYGTWFREIRPLVREGVDLPYPPPRLPDEAPPPSVGLELRPTRDPGETPPDHEAGR